MMDPVLSRPRIDALFRGRTGRGDAFRTPVAAPFPGRRGRCPPETTAPRAFPVEFLDGLDSLGHNETKEGGGARARGRAADMKAFLQTPTAQWVLLFAATAVLAAVAVYVVGAVRAAWIGRETPTSDLISSFHELHSQGELSDEEFRTIKTRLSGRLQSELKDTKDTG